jgi:peroxiredoxin Q/BCP
VLGVSPDSSKAHKKFEEKFEIPFMLLVDEEKKIIDMYGVWGEKNLYGRKYMGLHRTTFLIDEKGIIIKIFKKPRSKMHTQEILEAWDEVEEV